MKKLSKKEEVEREAQKVRQAWVKEHNFRDQNCCGCCKHHRFDNSLTKAPVFFVCDLATKMIGNPFVIVDYTYICDCWEISDKK
jgi:hypothetical protein